MSTTRRALFIVLVICLATAAFLSACRKIRDIPTTQSLPIDWTPTATGTMTLSPTITPSPTPTDTGAPTETPTSTPSPTLTFIPGVVCTATASLPVFAAEDEPTTVTGVNDYCGSPQVLGTLNTDLVLTGVLALTAGGAPSYAGSDYDLYRFTTGTAGTWRVTLDCFSTGSDGRNFDYFVYDNSCSTLLAWSNGTGPVETYAYTGLPAGTTFILWVAGADGPGGPYRLTIDAP